MPSARRFLALVLPALLAASLLAVVPAANAVNPPHGAIVSADPANFTPNVTRRPRQRVDRRRQPRGGRRHVHHGAERRQFDEPHPQLPVLLRRHHRGGRSQLPALAQQGRRGPRARARWHIGLRRWPAHHDQRQHQLRPALSAAPVRRRVGDELRAEPERQRLRPREPERPPVRRRRVHDDRRPGPHAVGRARPHDRCRRRLPEHPVHRQPDRRNVADLEVRHHAERQHDGGDRQLRHRRRSAPLPDRDRGSVDEPGDPLVMEHRPVPVLRHERRAAEDLVRRGVPALDPRNRHLARRHLRRRS